MSEDPEITQEQINTAHDFVWFDITRFIRADSTAAIENRLSLLLAKRDAALQHAWELGPCRESEQRLEQLCEILQKEVKDTKAESNWVVAQLRERLAAMRDSLIGVESTVEFYLKREIESPSNHQEFAREAQEKLDKFRAALAVSGGAAPEEAK